MTGKESLFSPRTESPDVLLEAARKYAREGRESHVLWASHFRAHRNGSDCDACTEDVIATAGDVEVQDEWVRKYDVILLALDLVDETLARLADEGMRDSRRLLRAPRAPLPQGGPPWLTRR